MRETLTSNPELFSDISWNLLSWEETAKNGITANLILKYNPYIIHIERIFSFIEKLSIDQDTV